MLFLRLLAVDIESNIWTDTVSKQLNKTLNGWGSQEAEEYY